MNITDVVALKWLDAERTILGGTVMTVEFGSVPICIHENYDVEYGRQLWDDAHAGKYGVIFEYVAPPEPTSEEKRAMMPKLEKWRVDTIIDLETGLRDKIDAAIAKWPDPKRTIAKNKLASVTIFDRLDPLFDELGSEPEVGKTPDDIDIMWTAGAALPPALT
ncbi:hypothetical protein BG46_11015 [Brucella anthropi]|uniref:hypothetical protein n=1 Tax=Brucella anthropi TaxID=529 RepID=UPI00044FFD4F|nr:hypothetical protein [Brucella anthropi]EXL07426.1 hypothetical protein BG46_11015 [Brucella anthropi]RRY13332.1 hypothetical protein EGJ58_03230 [Brucella anthropi]